TMRWGRKNTPRKFAITREQADQFSADSHRKALAAMAAGNFKDETIPVEVKITSFPNGNGSSSCSGVPHASRGVGAGGTVKPPTQTFIFSTDELPRADTNL